MLISTAQLGCVQGPLLDAVAIQLENYRPEHDIDGAAIPYADWEQWYRSIQVRGLSNSICHRKDPSASACQVAIFATIQWMYYALWCKRITFEHMVSIDSFRRVFAYLHD